MKLNLPVLMLLMMVACNVHAQQKVVRKDSSVKRVNNIDEPAIVFVYSHNDVCQLTEAASPSSRSFYTYTAEGQLHDQTLQFSTSTSNGFFNYSRFIYGYNGAGKTTSYITQFWNNQSNSFYNLYKDSNLYDDNQYKIKNFSQTWNDSSAGWVTWRETDYYNNGRGEPDSSVTNTYSQYDYTVKTYYTSYDSANVRHREYTYYIDSMGTIANRTRTTYYYDSANNVARDSAVFDNYAGGNNYIFTQATVATRFYDADGYVPEKVFAVLSTGYVSVTHVYSTFYVCRSVLPLSYIGFSVSQQQNTALLSWQVSDETNSGTYVIQRSSDGVHFTDIGSVKASGNNSGKYTFSDAGAFVTTLQPYYRLAETSYNGAVTYSNIISLSKAKDISILSISPNPVTSDFGIYSSVTINNAFVTIADINGKTLYSCKQNIIAGNKMSINTTGFAKGVYIVTIQSSSYKQQSKIIKQ